MYFIFDSSPPKIGPIPSSATKYWYFKSKIMRSLQIAIAFALFGLLLNCNKDEPNSAKTFGTGDKINFENLQVGQKNEYVFFIGENHTNLNHSNYLYFTDTLVVEVMSNDENGYLVKEVLTPGSASRNNASNVAFPEAEFYYYLDAKSGEGEDKLQLFSKESRIKTRLFQMSSQTTSSLPLNDLEEMEVEIVSWSTTQPFVDGVLEAYVLNFENFDFVFPRLNVYYDNRDIKFGAPGTINIYNKEYGLVRSLQYNSSTGKGYGWDLLP